MHEISPVLQKLRKQELNITSPAQSPRRRGPASLCSVSSSSRPLCSLLTDPILLFIPLEPLQASLPRTPRKHRVKCCHDSVAELCSFRLNSCTLSALKGSPRAKEASRTSVSCFSQLQFLSLDCCVWDIALQLPPPLASVPISKRLPQLVRELHPSLPASPTHLL